MTQMQEARANMFGELRNTVYLITSCLLATCFMPGTVLLAESIVVRYERGDKCYEGNKQGALIESKSSWELAEWSGKSLSTRCI